MSEAETPTQPEKVVKVSSPWLTYDEAAAYAKVSRRSIEGWVAAKILRVHRARGLKTVRFLTSDLDAVFEPSSLE